MNNAVTAAGIMGGCCSMLPSLCMHICVAQISSSKPQSRCGTRNGVKSLSDVLAFQQLAQHDIGLVPPDAVQLLKVCQMTWEAGDAAGPACKYHLVVDRVAV
eukprot:CAMPEP_0206135958 /NCGR_PEP_ID=MMETSP1473-20131121/1201_1 /ASSEMBLY_ACC=CAM_ASM_001109 /TAXON_ID=1461547 /ORGANISM="Stichococcus sp, Strain RCC1054" /LENGTH=101 /DNA_ID=CAMNT_0053528135 /DNA_START=220 /DNA_END=525 /DNA_ORIENTATION=+